MFHMFDKFDRFDRFDSSGMSSCTFLLPKFLDMPKIFFGLPDMFDMVDRFDRCDSSGISDRTFLFPELLLDVEKYFSDFLIWLICLTRLTYLIGLPVRECPL